jgi:hypothetical protein
MEPSDFSPDTGTHAEITPAILACCCITKPGPVDYLGLMRKFSACLLCQPKAKEGVDCSR